MVMNLTSNGLLFLLTRYLQSVLGHSALDAGIMLLQLFVPLAALSPLAGRLTAHHGPARFCSWGRSWPLPDSSACCSSARPAPIRR